MHLSFTQGGGHGGSHPHLAHEFITALIDNRDPFPNAQQKFFLRGSECRQSINGTGS